MSGMLSLRNVVPVVAATLNSQVCGALWYSPILFGGLWLAQLRPTPAQRDHMQRGFLRCLAKGIFIDLLLFLLLRQYRIGGSGAVISLADISMSVLTLTVLFSLLTAVHINWRPPGPAGTGSLVLLLLDTGYNFVKMFTGVWLIKYLEKTFFTP